MDQRDFDISFLDSSAISEGGGKAAQVETDERLLDVCRSRPSSAWRHRAHAIGAQV
jgi:hypothetical protein